MPQKPTNDLDALIQSLGGTFAPAPTQQPAAPPQQSNDDDLDSLITSLGGTVNAPSSTTRRLVGDTGVSLMKGLASIPQAIVGLADIPTGGRVGKALEDYAGYDPNFTDQYWESLYTPEQKAAFENVRRAEGFLGTLGEVGSNFSVVPHSVVESLPAMFLGGAIGRGVSKVAPALEAFAGGIGEGAVQAGQAAEQSRQDSQTGLLDTRGTVAAVGSGVGTGLLGILGGKIAKKLKIADIETVASTPGALAEALDQASSRTKLEVVRDVIYGAISEGMLEEFPQSVQEQVWANYAANKPLYEGVPQAAVLGALAGAAMGGGGNLIFGAAAPHQPPPPNQTPPPTAPPPVGAGQPPSIQPEPPVAPTGRPPIAPPPSTPPQTPIAPQPQPPIVTPEPEPVEQPPIITPEPTPEPEETEEQRAAREERERFLKLLEEEPEEEEGGTIGGTIPPTETPIITPETPVEPPPDETISGTIPEEEIELPTTRESPADFESVLKAARKLNPVVDKAELRRQFDERLDIVESAYPGDEEMRESGKDPVDLVRVIASLGGIEERDIEAGNRYWNKETGELRGLKEEAKGQGYGNSGAFGSFFGVPRVFRKGGLPPDMLVQSLQQFPRFRWIEGPNELFEFLTSEARNPTNREKFGRPALRLKDLGIDPEKAWWTRAQQPAIESGEQPPDVPIVTGKPPIKNVAMVEGEGEDTPFGERPQRNVIGSFSLEDAISPEAQVNLAKAFQSRKGARDLSRIRQAMEIHQNLIDMGTPEAQRQANELAIAVDNYFTPGKADHAQFEGYPEGETFLPPSKAAEAVEEAMWDGLKMVTGEEEPDWNQLAEREIIGDANETGAMILETLDPATAAFDTELFNSAYSDIEFRKDGDPFPAPKERVVVSEKTKTPKTYITQDQADNRIDKWVEEAYRIGREEDHSNEVIISLFDRTGAWSQPYEDAGYTVKRYDIKNGDDLTNFGDWMADIEMLIAEGYEIVGILGAPPCTTYTSSANRWIERRGIESREEIAKTFEIADIDKLKEKFKTPLDYANTLVAVMKLAVDQADPKFYALENPVGTIATHNALPQAPLTFDPNAFGDPYEKWTQIWGEFNPQLPTAYVEPTEESKMHNMGKQQRKLEGSETPSGFAYAFFMANNTAKTLNKALLTDVPPVQTGKPPIKKAEAPAAPVKGATAPTLDDKGRLLMQRINEQLDRDGEIWADPADVGNTTGYVYLLRRGKEPGTYELWMKSRKDRGVYERFDKPEIIHVDERGHDADGSGIGLMSHADVLGHAVGLDAVLAPMFQKGARVAKVGKPGTYTVEGVDGDKVVVRHPNGKKTETISPDKLYAWAGSFGESKEKEKPTGKPPIKKKKKSGRYEEDDEPEVSEVDTFQPEENWKDIEGDQEDWPEVEDWDFKTTPYREFTVARGTTSPHPNYHNFIRARSTDKGKTWIVERVTQQPQHRYGGRWENDPDYPHVLAKKELLGSNLSKSEAVALATREVPLLHTEESRAETKRQDELERLHEKNGAKDISSLDPARIDELAHLWAANEYWNRRTGQHLAEDERVEAHRGYVDTAEPYKALRDTLYGEGYAYRQFDKAAEAKGKPYLKELQEQRKKGKKTGKPPIKAKPEQLTPEERADRTELVREHMAEKHSVLGSDVRALGMEDELKAAGYKEDGIGLWWSHPDAVAEADKHAVQNKIDYRWKTIGIAEAEKAGLTQAVIDAGYVRGKDDYAGEVWLRQPEKKSGKPPIKSGKPVDVRLPGDVGKVRDTEVETPKIPLPQQGLTLKTEEAPEGMRTPAPSLFGSDEGLSAQQKAAHQDVRDAFKNLGKIIGKNSTKLNAGIPPIDQELAYAVYEVVKAMAKAGIVDAQVAWDNIHEWMGDVAGDLRKAFRVAWRMQHKTDPVYTTTVQKSATPEQAAERVKAYQARQAQREAEEQKTAPKQEPKQEPKAAPKQEPPKPARPQPMSRDIQAIGEERLNFGSFTKRNIKVKDISTVDINHALEILERLTSARARYVSKYLAQDPVILQALGEFATPKITEQEQALFDRLGIKLTVNGPLIEFTGNTFEHRAIFSKTKAAKYLADTRIWFISGRNFGDLVRNFEGVEGGSTTRRNQVAAHVTDPRLRALREAAEREPDRSGFDQGVSAYVSNRTQELIREGGNKLGIDPKKIDEQIEDVAMTVRAYDNEQGAMIIASEPGTGKTFVIGGSIRELLKRGAKKIVVVTKNKKLIQQAKENLAAYGIMDDKRVDYITYHGLRNTDPIDTDAIFFDEAHSVKNVKKTADAARQALMGQEWIKRTKFTVLASGTPYENPTQIQYLAPTKLFDKAFGGYHDFAQAYGARAVPINDKGDFLYRWEPTTTSEDDQKKAREWIRKQGVFTARRIELEPGQVETRLAPVKVDAEWQAMYDAMVRAKTQFPKMDPKWLKNFTKRVMEAAKLPVAIEEAQRALDRGRFPVIFIETYSQRIFEIAELLRLDAEYEEDSRQKRAQGLDPDKRSDWGLPPKYVPQFLAEVGRQIGKDTIEIPPAEDVIKEAFGDSQVAVYLGSNSKADKDLAAWRTGEKPVMVATMGKGGTGLSLHDTTGEHPVTQINVILPWTATSITQVSGRAARYGMKGMAEILWLFAREMGADLQLAARVGQRMSDMGALVHGQPLENAQNFRSGTFNDPMFGEIGEEEEEDDDDRVEADSYDTDTDSAPRERNVIGTPPAEERKTFYDEEGEEGTHPETDEPIYPIEIPELVEIIRDLLGSAPLVKRMSSNIRGAFSQSGLGAKILVNAGLFQQGKEIEVAQTIAHELGHAVDYLPDETMKRGNLLGRIKSLTEYLKHTFVNPNGDIIMLADVREELKELSMLWRPWDPATATESHKKYRNSGKELFADAMSALFRNPALLQRTAPIFYKEVFDTLARKPEVEDKYYEVQAAMAGTEEQKSERRLEYDRTATEGGTAKAVQVEKRKVQKRKESFKAWWLRLKSEFKHLALKMEYPIIDRITKKNIQLSEDLDPRYAFSERNYVGGKRKGWVQRNVEPLYDVLMQHEISWTDFGLFLKYEREIKGDRQNLANPAGSSPKVAQGKLDAMMREFTPEQREAITVAADKFRDAIRDIVDQAYAAGIYSTEAYEKFSEHYVTFHVLDYIDQAVTAKMFRQKGTLKDVKNAADASIIKMLVTIGEIENQKTKKLTFNFLKRFYPEEIEDGGPIAHRKRKKNTDLEEVGYWKNGVWHLQYVDPLIADALNRNTVGRNNAIIKAISFVNSKVFRPVFTGLNPGFQSFNVMRDFLRTWKTSGMSLAQTAKRYVDGMPLAKVRAFGVRDPEAKGVRESIKNGILKAIGVTYSKELQAFEDLLQAEQSGTLSITFNDFNSGRHVEETEILDIMARVGARKSEPPRTGWRKLPMAKQLEAGVEFVKSVGDFIETLPKAAAMYEMIGTDRQIKDLTPKERALIRERIGSPDYLAGGTLKPVTNEIWLFSNAITQAWLADYQSAREDYKSYTKGGDPKTRSGYLWKTAAINVLPKMLMMAAAVGLMGDWLRKLFENVSEYDKTNYLAIPITLDENGNTIYLRLPQDDVGRFVGGLTWKALRLMKGDKDVIETLAQVVDYTSGQFPSVTPTIGAVKDTLELAAGQNPYDEFRSRNLFTDDEMAAGGYQKFSKFVGWEFQQLGGSIIYKFYPGESRPQEQTEGQRRLDWPVVSNTLGRWLRISNYGEHEIYRDIEKAVGKEEATRRLQEREQVNDAIREYMKTPSFLRQGDRGRGQRFALARKIAENIYTESARRPNGTIDRDELSRRTNLIQKKIQMGAIRGHADPLVERVIAAQSNLQRKEIIKKGRQTMTTEEYVGWLDRAASNAVISRELSQELKRDARVH